MADGILRHIVMPAALALAFGAIWGWKRKRRRAQRSVAAKNVQEWSVRAYAFQSDYSFSDAMDILIGGPYGDWFERDSAWYDELLSCPPREGVRMNLYFFPDQKVLEMKAAGDGVNRVAAESYALEILLPALKALELRRTEPVN